MAEIQEDLIREQLKNALKPVDSSGVLEKISARVAAGDTGAPQVSGWGGLFSKVSTWLPWAAGIVVSAVVGVSVGASGLFGSLQATKPVDLPGASIAFVAMGLNCPGGSPVVGFSPGERVLAVSRSEDSSYLGVRNPTDRSQTVWVQASKIKLDPEQPRFLRCPSRVVLQQQSLSYRLPSPALNRQHLQLQKNRQHLNLRLLTQPRRP